MAERWAAPSWLQGGVQLGRIAGVPVRFTWTVPLGLFVFSGFRFLPVSWLGLLFVILLHEFGHAMAVKLAGGTPTEVRVTALGGLCFWNGEVSPLGRAGIAAGGVGAQLLLLGAVMLVQALVAVPPEPWLLELLYVFTLRNVYLVALNLLPFAPLDGAEAWRFPLLLGKAARAKLQPASALADTATQATAEQVARDLLEQAKKGEP